MTLLLNNDEIEKAADPVECIAASEAAYRQLGAGNAFAGHRADLFAPNAKPGTAYNLKVMSAVYEHDGISAVRLTSDVVSWPSEDTGQRRVKLPRAPGGRWTGLVLLLSTHTGEPLALLPDGVLQRLRVGATSALAMRHLARDDAKDLCIIGSG